MKDIRLIELALLRALIDNAWGRGVYAGNDVQSRSIACPPELYADLVVTLMEDGGLIPLKPSVLDKLRQSIREYHTERAALETDLKREVVDVRVSYRGLRRADELRQQLRTDRVLDRFGILIDGRYVRTSSSRCRRCVIFCRSRVVNRRTVRNS